MEFKYVERYADVIKLFPLFHKFFDRTTPDYTEKEFFSQLNWILDNGVIGYLEEEGTPIAYGIMLKTNLLREYALILQVYSDRPFAIRRLMKEADEVSRSWGVDKQIAIVDPKVAMYFSRHYKMAPKFFIMERSVEQAEEAVM